MDFEKYFETGAIKGRVQCAIAPRTARALKIFCKQEQEFKQAVEQSGKSFQECLDSITKGIGNSIPDLEVYNRAVKFYFSTASVHFSMYINMSGENGYTPPPIIQNVSKPSGLSVSLDELLDF